MGTHIWYCVWCGKQTGCCADEHVLGVGQADTCTEEVQARVDWTPDYQAIITIKTGVPQPIEYCTFKCFLALKASMDERLELIKRDYQDWFAE